MCDNPIRERRGDSGCEGKPAPDCSGKGRAATIRFYSRNSVPPFAVFCENCRTRLNLRKWVTSSVCALYSLKIELPLL